jgi:hypothetical protein
MTNAELRDEQWEKIYAFLKQHQRPMQSRKWNAGISLVDFAQWGAVALIA